MPGLEGANSFVRLPPLTIFSLVYLFEDTIEAVRLVVQRLLTEGVGY